MTTTAIIPSYPYVQFADDVNISAWFAAYNTYAQKYLDWFNDTPLFDYTNSSVTGAFLDWIANGVYGVYRTPIPCGQGRYIGPLNTYTPNEIPLNQQKESSGAASYAMTDDIFRRVITWNFYKGDGLNPSIPWLKRRVARFLGADVVGHNDISITISSRTVSIKIINSSNYNSTVISNMKSVISLGYVNLPFNYTFTVEAA